MQILKTQKLNNETIASLDNESLFTNVSVRETIDVTVYNGIIVNGVSRSILHWLSYDNIFSLCYGVSIFPVKDNGISGMKGK